MATIEDTDTSSRLGSRLRDGLALAQTRIHTIEEQAKSQWEDLPAQARATLNRMLARIRTTLDLPSRNELVGLVERIEELDRKLDDLERRQRLASGSPGAGRSTKAKANSTSEVTEPAVEDEEATALAATREAMQAAKEAEAAEQIAREAEAAAQEAAREAEAVAREAAAEEKQDAAKEAAPARQGQQGQEKKNGTHTKKARRTSAGKTLTSGDKKKTAPAGKRPNKGRSRDTARASDKRK